MVLFAFALFFQFWKRDSALYGKNIRCFRGLPMLFLTSWKKSWNVLKPYKYWKNRMKKLCIAYFWLLQIRGRKSWPVGAGDSIGIWRIQSISWQPQIGNLKNRFSVLFFIQKPFSAETINNTKPQAFTGNGTRNTQYMKHYKKFDKHTKALIEFHPTSSAL